MKKTAKKPGPSTLKQFKRKAKILKIKVFLLITLPVAIAAIGQAVIREYARIKIREAASRGTKRQTSPSPEPAKQKTL